MKHQDTYPYDPTITAPKIVFQQVGNNTFFVNSSCILATRKVITTGKEYLLADYSLGNNVKITNVLLAECYYKRGILHLILRDIRSQIVSTLDHSIEYPENECTWLIVDMDYFKDRENIRTIQAYCCCDNDPKKKANTGNNHKSIHDDLLEFEF